MNEQCVVCGEVFDKQVSCMAHYTKVLSVCGVPCFMKHWKKHVFHKKFLIPSTTLKYNDTRYKNEWEKKFHEFLLKHGFYAIYEPIVFDTGRGTGYLPDFLILGDQHAYFEVKGRWEVGAFNKFSYFSKRHTAYVVDYHFLKRMGVL